nr:putative zinc finger, CCHC-type [Tanacetum cinerariifolium]
MEEFAKKGVGSIILTSGTLSPMDSFAEELKLNFPVRLENPHVISDNQLWAGIVLVDTTRTTLIVTVSPSPTASCGNYKYYIVGVPLQVQIKIPGKNICERLLRKDIPALLFTRKSKDTMVRRNQS